jgi:hypothetical protein
VSDLVSCAVRVIDWHLLAIMERSESPAAVAGDLAPSDPVRAEALLHAWPTDPRGGLENANWAQPFLERWPLVETAMAGLEPVTWTHERIEDIARAARVVA